VRDFVKRKVIEHTERNIQAAKLVQPHPKLTDAQFLIARGHGFESRPVFAKQIQEFQRDNSPDARFEAAADAIVSGDIRTLERLLRDEPELVRARSQRTHHGTLLHYVAANGVEDFRQKTPANIVDIAKLLLDSGANVNAEAGAYGGGATTLGLAATSVHTERAGVQEDLMRTLLHYGPRWINRERPEIGIRSSKVAFGTVAAKPPGFSDLVAQLSIWKPRPAWGYLMLSEASSTKAAH
jgi:hypothetical protein